MKLNCRKISLSSEWIIRLRGVGIGELRGRVRRLIMEGIYSDYSKKRKKEGKKERKMPLPH